MRPTTAGFALAFWFAIALNAAQSDSPRVLIDLSHEFTFRYDIFGGASYFAGADEIAKTSDFAALSVQDLEPHDVLVLSQASAPHPYEAGEIELIRRFVSEGGGLWIAANAADFRAANGSAAAYPLEAVAKAFGLSFAAARSGEYRVVDHALTVGTTSLRVDEGTTTNTLVIETGAWQPLVTDSAGQPVIAVVQYGAGRLFVSAQDAIISNPYQRPDVGNAELVRRVIKWLAEGKRGSRSRSPQYRISPEIVENVGPIRLMYPRTLRDAPGLTFMREQLQPAIQALETSIHKVRVQQELTFVALAGAGGGYSGGSEVGIAVGARREDMLMILAHEVTHSFDATGGSHPEWMHGWPSFAAIRLARLPQYGGAFAALGNGEFTSRVDAFRAYEGSHGANSLDITQVMRGDFTNSWAIGGKLMAMIEEMEHSYGPDLMPRMYRIKRRYGTGGQHSTEAMIRWLSLAAGSDLTRYFVSRGTTVMGSEARALPVVYETTPATTDDAGIPLRVASKHQFTDDVIVNFNVDMDEATFTNVFVSDDTGRTLNVAVVSLGPRTMAISPLPSWPSAGQVRVTLPATIRSRAGEALDGDGDGIAEPADSFSFAFSPIRPKRRPVRR